MSYMIKSQNKYDFRIWWLIYPIKATFCDKTYILIKSDLFGSTKTGTQCMKGLI